VVGEEGEAVEAFVWGGEVGEQLSQISLVLRESQQGFFAEPAALLLLAQKDKKWWGLDRFGSFDLSSPQGFFAAIAAKPLSCSE
jgi:hypothetical protein